MPVVNIYKHVIAGVIRYIGETSKPIEERLKEHWWESRRGNKKSHRLMWLRSLDLPPNVELIEQVPVESAEEREVYWIALAQEYGCSLVNGTPGGAGMGKGEEHPMFGKPRSPETRKKDREVKLGKKTGPPSLAHRAKISAALKGRPFSSEHCAKISAGKSGEKNPMYQKKPSAETLAKRAATREKNRILKEKHDH